MHYLVTGGAGFIGSSIVHELLERGNKVTVLDDLSSGNLANLEAVLPQVELVEGSILDLPLLKKILPSIQAIIHQAAIPSVPLSIQHPIESHHANATGTLNLLEVARQSGVKRFVYASSSSVYGESPTLPKVETMSPDPLSPYAVNKLCGEYYCRIYHQLHQMETVCLRYFNVFGPRQNPQSQYAAVIPKFIQCFLENKAPTVYGDGEQSRDFTYIQNVVEANILASTAPGVGGQVFNLAGGQTAITLNELIQKLQKLLSTSIQPDYQPPRLGDVKHSLADVHSIEEKLGFKNQVSFDEGLKRTVEWYKQHLGTKK